MNASEFEQALGAAPRETAEAQRGGRGDDDPARDAAVTDALAFEDRLEAALRVAVDEDTLLGGILDRQRAGDHDSDRRQRLPVDSIASQRPSGRRGPPAWLSLAATVMVVAGVAAVLLWPAPPPQDLGEYVRSHYRHDGAGVLARAGLDGGGVNGQAMAPAAVQELFTALGAEAGPEFTAQIRYAKFCPTPNGRGAHLVLGTPDGPATVIYMPTVEVAGPVLIEFDGITAEVIRLARGSAAIVGASEGAMQDLRTRLEAGIRPLPAKT